MPSSPPGTPPTPGPACGPRLPGHQDPRRLRRGRVARCPGPPSTTSPAWNGSAPARTWRSSVRPGPARATCLVALGLAAVEAGRPGPLLRRHRPRRDPLPGPRRQLRRPGHRGPPARRPGHHRRARVRAAGRHRRPAAVPVRRRRLRTPLPRHRLPLAVRAAGAGSCPSTPPPSACWTGSCTTPSSWSPKGSPSGCAKAEPEQQGHHTIN